MKPTNRQRAERLRAHAQEISDLLEKLLPLLESLPHPHTQALIGEAAKAGLLIVIRLNLAASNLETIREGSL